MNNQVKQMEVVPKFSVIIPHKNIPVLLERLLKSIPRRNDLEIIVVDDNSSPDIVDFSQLPLSDRDNLCYVLNKESRGAGYARNCALSLVKGDWILFADSDDFFNSGFEDFLEYYKDSDADIVYFSANSVDTDTYEPSNRVNHLYDFLDVYHKDKEKGEKLIRYMFTEPWCKMVKRELIEKNGIRFDETSIHEDVKYSYLVGYYAKQIIIDERQLYCVTSRKGSLSRSRGYQFSLDEMKVFAGWKKFFIDHNIELDLPKYDYRLYNMSRHLYKDNGMFRREYQILRHEGFGHLYICREMVKYLWKSVGYKLNKY